MWDVVIRAKRLSVMRPVLERVLSTTSSTRRGEVAIDAVPPRADEPLLTESGPAI